jgi:molybdopterin-binding protein
MEASTERYRQADLDPLSGIISNFLGSVNSGTITIELNKQPIFRLKINQNDIDRINLEFGQKFMAIILEAFTEMISGKIKNVS